MTSPRLCFGAGAAFAVALLPALLVIPAGSAPVPQGNPTIRLTPAGEVKVADLSLRAAAVIDDTTVVLVGTRVGPEEAHPTTLPPNGAIIDLTTKAARPFTNGHTACIDGVAAIRGRVVTGGTNKDPTIRVWDRTAGKTVATVEVEKPGNEFRYYAVAGFHRSNKVAVTADNRVVVLDLDRPGDRIEFKQQELAEDTTNIVAVSPDDAYVACATLTGCRAIIWEVATRRATAAVSLLPDRVDPAGWFVHDIAFGPQRYLFACRSGKDDEVPEKAAESDVPPERRGLVRVDATTGRVEPLRMGHTGRTLSCAVDPTGTWVATTGWSRPDQPRPDGSKSVGELRVYHLPTRTLTYREQVMLADHSPTWVAFTPSGKRLVCANGKGVVKWWDVAVGSTAPAQPSAKPGGK